MLKKLWVLKESHFWVKNSTDVNYPSSLAVVIINFKYACLVD